METQVRRLKHARAISSCLLAARVSASWNVYRNGMQRCGVDWIAIYWNGVVEFGDTPHTAFRFDLRVHNCASPSPSQHATYIYIHIYSCIYVLSLCIHIFYIYTYIYILRIGFVHCIGLPVQMISAQMLYRDDVRCARMFACLLNPGATCFKTGWVIHGHYVPQTGLA